MLLLAPAACRAPEANPSAADQPAVDQPAADIAPATAPSPTPATLPSPATLPTPATAVPAPTAPAEGQLARFDGYGDLRLGMGASEAQRAWGGELEGKAGPGETCWYFRPVHNRAPSDLAFMVVDDRLVRYDVGSDRVPAPGGGKVGMLADDIRRLYPERVTEKPHHYVEGGRYLRIPADDGPGVLLFETDAAGKVTRWRVGLPPQVDWIEGCA